MGSLGRAGWLLGVAILLVAYLVRTVGTGSEDPVTQDSRAVLKIGQACRQRLTRLDEMRQRLEQQAVVFRARERRHADARDSLSHALVMASNATDSLQIGQELTHHIIAAGDACDSAFTADSLALATCGETNALLLVRLDTLEHALARQLRVGSCHIAFLRCPTRGQVFVTGLLMGGAMGVWATQ